MSLDLALELNLKVSNSTGPHSQADLKACNYIEMQNTKSLQSPWVQVRRVGTLGISFFRNSQSCKASRPSQNTNYFNTKIIKLMLSIKV